MNPTGRSSMCSVVIGVAGCLLCASTVHGHETDQYTLPLDTRFADVGDWLDAVHCRALERAVEQVNRKIDIAAAEQPGFSRDKRLQNLRSPVALVEPVYARFNDAFTEIQDVEFALRSAWAKEAHPGEICAYRTIDWVYTHAHFWLDPRRLVTVWQSSTIKAYDVYFGTDKLSHFHHMGHVYYTTWRDNLARGESDAGAVQNVIDRYSSGGPLGENGALGFVSTGVYSNADLAANYAGFKFYRNLTEPVMIKGELRPPLVLLVNGRWRINKHVRPESGWFGAFVSDHWNEAFNPCLYDLTLRSDIESLLKERAVSIVRFWTEQDGRPADAEYFARLERELTTYWGEPYGHSGEPEKIFGMADTVLPAWREARRAAGMPETLGITPTRRP